MERSLWHASSSHETEGREKKDQQVEKLYQEKHHTQIPLFRECASLHEGILNIFADKGSGNRRAEDTDMGIVKSCIQGRSTVILRFDASTLQTSVFVLLGTATPEAEFIKLNIETWKHTLLSSPSLKS